MSNDSLAGKRVVVMGLGRFGGGVGVTRWLVRQQADVLVTDLDPPEKLAESLEAIRGMVDAGRVELRLGGHNVSDFTTADLVVANPAVPRPWENRFLRAAEAAGVRITSEIALTLARLPTRSRLIGVTGTAGKSTTAALIHHGLERLGQRALLAGNIGRSLLPELDTIDRESWIVLELSSFQLHWIGRELPVWAPRVAVCTTIAPNHLDWHITMDHYVASKQILFRAQDKGDAAVLGPSVAHWPTSEGVERRLVPQGARLGPLLLPGRHNQLNAALAAEAIEALGLPGIDRAQIAQAMADFPGLPHRLQMVARLALPGGEALAYNDSKSTTPEATLLAIDALAEEAGPGRVHLIAGGYDKGSDLLPIATRARELAGLYTIGVTGPGLASAARQAGATRVRECGRLDRAVEAARAALKPGDALLLSPGCASWDQFDNYERRGERFVELVRAGVSGVSAP